MIKVYSYLEGINRHPNGIIQIILRYLEDNVLKIASNNMTIKSDDINVDHAKFSTDDN